MDTAPKHLSVTKITTSNQLLHGIVALLLSFFLAGCSGGAESVLTEYQTRLANLLDETTEKPDLPEHPSMPRANELSRDIPSLSISLLDSFRLDRCRVGQVIAERNSALGKLRNPGLQLFYEINVIRALHECIESEELNDSLTQTLADALEHKEQTLPLYVERFLTTDDVIRQRMRPGRSILPREPASGAEESLAALRYFNNLFDTLKQHPLSQEVSLDDYRLHLRTLGQNDFLSEHWQTQRVMLSWMRELNRTLDNGADKMGCRPPSIPAEAEYLQNVMHKYFIEQVQVWLALWDGYQRDVNQQVEDLMAHTTHESWLSYVEQLTGSESHATQLRDATVKHAQLWQRTLEGCNLQPTGS